MVRNGRCAPASCLVPAVSTGAQQQFLWLQVHPPFPCQHQSQWNTGRLGPYIELVYQQQRISGVTGQPHALFTQSFAHEMQDRIPIQSLGDEQIQSRGDEQIIDHYMQSRVPVEEYIARWKIVKRLETVLRGSGQFSRQYPLLAGSMGLFIIGSSKTELGFKSDAGDLDVCLVISNDEVSRREAVGILRCIEGVLRTSGWCNVQVITAVVPILIFTDEPTTIVCDLNINNRVGIKNSYLLTCYANFDWRVKPLILFIKKWARLKNINSARHKTICSYALTLMVIGYLQIGLDKPVLPCLQQAYPQRFTDDLQTLVSNPPTFPPFPESRRNTMSLSDLLFGFFDFYVHGFRFERDVLSVRRGQILPIDQVRWEQTQQRMSQYGASHSVDRDRDAQTPSYTYDNAYMFIEEPFNRTNVARSVHDLEVFQEIRKVFLDALNKLSESRQPYAIL